MKQAIFVAVLLFSGERAFAHLDCVSGITLENAAHSTQDQAYCFWYSEAPKFGSSPAVWDFLEIFVKTSTVPMTLAISANGARRILQENLPRISSGTLVRAAEVLKEASSVDDTRVKVSATSALLSLGRPFERDAKQQKNELLKRFWAHKLDAYYLMGSWGQIMDTRERIEFCEAIIDHKMDARSVFVAVDHLGFAIKDSPKITSEFRPGIISHLKTVMETHGFGFSSRVMAAEHLFSLKALTSDELYNFTVGAIMAPGDLTDTHDRYAYCLHVHQVVTSERPRESYEKAVQVAVRTYHVDKDAEDSANQYPSSSNHEPREYFETLKGYR